MLRRDLRLVGPNLWHRADGYRDETQRRSGLGNAPSRGCDQPEASALFWLSGGSLTVWSVAAPLDIGVGEKPERISKMLKKRGADPFSQIGPACLTRCFGRRRYHRGRRNSPPPPHLFTPASSPSPHQPHILSTVPARFPRLLNPKPPPSGSPSPHFRNHPSTSLFPPHRNTVNSRVHRDLKS